MSHSPGSLRWPGAKIVPKFFISSHLAILGSDLLARWWVRKMIIRLIVWVWAGGFGKSLDIQNRQELKPKWTCNMPCKQAAAGSCMPDTSNVNTRPERLLAVPGKPRGNQLQEPGLLDTEYELI